MNKKFINFIFALLVALGLLSLFWTFLLHRHDFEIPFFSHSNADIRINIETASGFADKIHFSVQNREIEPYIMKTKNTYVSYEINKVPVWVLGINPENPDKIKNIVIFISNKIFYFEGKDILNFEKNKDGAYIFPSYVKFSKNSKYINDKGPLKNFSINFLSIFYNSKYFIFPLVYFALAVFIYLSNKDKINLGFEIFKNNAIWWLLLLGALLRLADNGFSFWSDELYTSTVAGNPDLPFSSVFFDPGNPPLFFIFAKFWGKLFNQNESLLRVLPCIFSTLTIGGVYVFVKKYTNKGTALLCAFLYTTGIYAIHSGQEFRCYSLGALLAVVCAYYLFKIIKEKKTKDFVIYGILAALAANTHYFQILILLGNFVYGNIFLDNKSRVKFFFSNLVGALAFLPYFYMTAFKGALLNKSFNELNVPDLHFMWEILIKLFTGKFILFAVLILALCLFVPKIKAKFEGGFVRVYLYSICTVLFLALSSYLFSQIRPIIRPYYFINVLPFVIILTGLCALIPFKNRFLKAAFPLAFLVVLFNFGTYIKKDVTILVNFENVFQYAFFDSKKFVDSGKKVGIALHDYPDYALFYKKYSRGDEEIIMYRFLVDPYKFLEILKNSSADVIYARLEYKRFPAFAAVLSEIAEVSILRCDKDVLISRILKKEAL